MASIEARTVRSARASDIECLRRHPCATLRHAVIVYASAEVTGVPALISDEMVA